MHWANTESSMQSHREYCGGLNYIFFIMPILPARPILNILYIFLQRDACIYHLVSFNM